jgi:hypothetical protein
MGHLLLFSRSLNRQKKLNVQLTSLIVVKITVIVDQSLVPSGGQMTMMKPIDPLQVFIDLVMMSIVGPRVMHGIMDNLLVSDDPLMMIITDLQGDSNGHQIAKNRNGPQVFGDQQMMMMVMIPLMSITDRIPIVSLGLPGVRGMLLEPEMTNVKHREWMPGKLKEI